MPKKMESVVIDRAAIEAITRMAIDQRIIRLDPSRSSRRPPMKAPGIAAMITSIPNKRNSVVPQSKVDVA